MNRPFDAARYTGLLEGLEATVIPYSQIGTEFRIEPEFFKKRYLHEASALAHLPQRRIGEFATVTDGPHGYHVVDEASRIVMLTAKNGKHWFSDREGADPIAAWVDTNNRRSSLGANDIILSTRGTVGLCALVTEETLPANIDQDVARISWKDKLAIRPEYVAAYLNSSFGQDHIERYASGMVQQGLSLQKVREIPIPVLSTKVQNAITSVVESALAHRRSTKNQLHAAEHNLLLTLGLADWRAPQPLSYVRNSRDAFAAGRLDAEYFNPATRAILGVLARQGDCALDDLCRVTTGYAWQSERFVENGAGDGIPFVRIRDCKPGGIWAEDLDMLDADYAATQNQPHANPGDIVVGMDGLKWFYSSLLMSDAYVNQRVAWLIPSRDDYPAEYLLTVLNSLVGQRQLLSRMTIAQTVGHITLEDLRTLRIPILDPNARHNIAAQARSAITNRQRAMQLLDAAKRAVEIAIEDSEAAALAWLQDARAQAEGAL